MHVVALVVAVLVALVFGGWGWGKGGTANAHEASEAKQKRGWFGRTKK